MGRKKENLRVPQKRQRLTRDRVRRHLRLPLHRQGFPDLRNGILSFFGLFRALLVVLHLGYLLGTVVVYDVNSMFRSIEYLIYETDSLEET